MEVNVIKAVGVTVDNPNLPNFYGVDLSKSLVPVLLKFGSDSTVVGENSLHLDAVGGDAPSGIYNSELLDVNGALSPLSITLPPKFYDLGGSYFFLGAYKAGYDTMSADVLLKGLHPLRRYTIRILAVRALSSTSRVGVYSIGSASIEIDASGNTEWAEIVSVYPDQSGVISLNVYAKEPGGYAYLNEIEVVES
jgi:hypothetical protein